MNEHDLKHLDKVSVSGRATSSDYRMMLNYLIESGMITEKDVERMIKQAEL